MDEEDRLSKLKLYSLGIVVTTKPDNTDIIEVTPIEELPFLKDDIKNIKETYKTKTIDHKGIERTSSAESTAVLNATWIPFGHSNRISSPDVVANETVILFRYADTDEYYWTTIFREPILRRLEKVLYAFCNLSTGIAKQAFDRLTSYWFEVSTKDKYVWLKTTTSDGEPFEYDVKINTKEGTVLITDNIGNKFSINSPDHRVELMNADGSHYDMNKGDLTITTPTSITHKTTNYNVNATNINISGDSSIKINSPSTTID